MPRKPAAPSNLRNGLKWRDGRPRWEPSPANRACGFAGMNLTDHEGRWMDRGAATSAADARTAWAAVVRDALRDDDAGGKARRDLRAALDALPPVPAEAEGRRRRELVADLIERGRAVLENREPGMTAALCHAPRTVAAMREAYLDDRAAMTRLTPGSQKLYRILSKRLVARFGPARVDEVTPGQLLAWHRETTDAVSLGTANVAMGVAGAMFSWAVLQDPPWLTASPVHKLRLPKAQGRRVFWTLEEERIFVSWCDANGFEDVADALTICLWTGARQVDVCKATLEDLSGLTWRFIPQKTEKRGQQALPGILPPVTARVERRRAAAAAAGLPRIGGTPVLIDPLGRKHTSDTIGARFRAARADAIKAKAMPEGWSKRLQDARDTCVTRLYDAGVELARIGSWGGWSRPDAILREHYLTLLDHGAIVDAGKLREWAERNGLVFAA